jgi:HEAT repeat protein
MDLEIDLNAVASRLSSPKPADRMVGLVQLRQVPSEIAVPLILKVVEDEHQQVRSFAVFALGLKPTDASLSKLLEIVSTDPDYGVRADAAGALGYLGDVRAFESLVRAFYEDVEWLVQFSAIVALGNLKDGRAYDLLMYALQMQDSLMHQAAIAALGEIADPRCVDRILQFAQSEDWLVRQRLAMALATLPSPKTRSALEYLAKDPNDSVAAAALSSLREVQEQLDLNSPEA